MKRRFCKSKRGLRRGVTAVEFAIVAPVFFLILIASIELSRLSVMRNTADHAAYEAARIALVPGATAGEAVAAANQLMDVVGTNGAQVIVNPAVLNDDTTEVTVTVAVDFNQNALLVPRFLPEGSSTVSGTSTLRTERVATIGDF